MSSRKLLMTLAVLISITSVSAFAAQIEKRTLTSRGKERIYYIFAPDSTSANAPASLLITLHGSGRRGSSLVETWKGLAAKSNLIVAGPDSIDTAQWGAPEDGPRLLRDLVEEIKTKHAIDERRIYLFGHSAGACFAIQMGLLQSEYFAAVALHAGALVPEAYGLTTHATRKIPFAMFVGTKDPNFPVETVRATRDALEKEGIPADLTEIRNHTHNYYSRANEINRSAWAFLEQHTLAAEPKYTEYSNLQ